eukprot:3487025-Pyramimonas_sp.AAC.1
MAAPPIPAGSHVATHPCRYTSHTVRGHILSSTSGTSGGVHMQPPRSLRHTSPTFRGPTAP